jgi:hypothetical protein
MAVVLLSANIGMFSHDARVLYISIYDIYYLYYTIKLFATVIFFLLFMMIYVPKL